MNKTTDLLIIWIAFVATQLVVETTTLVLTEDRIKDITQKIQHDHVESLPYGVMFKKNAVLDLSSSVWPHIIKIPMIKPMVPLPTYRVCNRLPNLTPFIIRFFSKEPNETQAYMRSQFADMKKGLCQEWQALSEDYNQLIKRVIEDGNRGYQTMRNLVLPNKYVKPVSKNRRPKRWDMSFMGQATGNFFGLATTNDLVILKDAIGKIADETLEVARDFSVFKEDMISVNTLQNSRISTLAKNLKNSMNTINAAIRMTSSIHRIAQAQSSWDQTMHQMLIKTFSEVSVLMDAVINYRQLIQDRTHAIGWLNQHLLTPNLVAPEELKNILKGLEKHLLERYPPFRFGFESEEYFYRIPSTSYTADKDFLYVQIKIPLTVMAAHYHTYEVLSVPLVAADGTSQFTQIKNLPEYVAFSIQGDTYTTLSSEHVRNCLGVGVKRCPQRLLEVSTSVNSCILGLFLNDQNMTDQYCQVDLILTPNINEMALDIGDGKFFISNVDPGTEWVIACPQTRPRSVAPCRSCIISLQCRCTLKTASAFISASLTGCQDMETTSGVSKSYIPNLMWIKYLANFTDEPQSLYNTSTVLDHDPLEDLPHVTVPSYLDVQSFVEEDEAIATSLDSVLEKAKKGEPIYVNRLQQLSTETKFMLFKNHHGVPLALVGVVWNFLITIAVIWLIRQNRQLAAMIIYNAQPVEGARLANSISQKWGIVQYCLVYLVIALTAVLLIRLFVLAKKIRKFLKEQKKFHPPSSTTLVTTKVFIEITSGNQAVTLFADEIKAPQHLLKVVLPNPLPNIPKFDVESNWRRDILIMDWKDIHILHTQTELTIPLPAAIESPRRIRFLMNSLLSAPRYHLSIVLVSGVQHTSYPIGLIANADPFSFQCTRGMQKQYGKAPPRSSKRGTYGFHPYTKSNKPDRPHLPRSQLPKECENTLYDKLDPIQMPKKSNKSTRPTTPFRPQFKVFESSLPTGKRGEALKSMGPSATNLQNSLVNDMMERADKMAYGASYKPPPDPHANESQSDDSISLQCNMSDVD